MFSLPQSLIHTDDDLVVYYIYHIIAVSSQVCKSTNDEDEFYICFTLYIAQSYCINPTNDEDDFVSRCIWRSLTALIQPMTKMVLFHVVYGVVLLH